MPVENEKRIDPKSSEAEVFRNGAWFPDVESATATDGSASVWLGTGVTTTGVANNGNLPRGTHQESSGTGITEDPDNNHSWILEEGTWSLYSLGFNSTNSSSRTGGHVWLVDGAEKDNFGNSYGNPPIVRPAMAIAIVPAGETKTVSRRNRAGHGTSNGNSGHVFIRKESIKGGVGSPGQGLDHISRTSGDGSQGTTDIYTAWGDAAETINLGTFDVPIPSPMPETGGMIGTVIDRSPAGTGQTNYNFQLGMEWSDFKSEYPLIALGLDTNSFDGDDVTQFHWTEDLVEGEEINLSSLVNGTTMHLFHAVVPSDTATAMNFDADGAGAFGGAWLRGIKMTSPGPGITTTHRSDGATAIGGTVYTLDHVIYEFDNGTFKDMGLLEIPPLQLMTGDGDERPIPGKFWKGKQVWGRDIDRVMTGSGFRTLISGSEVDRLVGAEGVHGTHSGGQRSVVGTHGDGRSWAILQNGGAGTNIQLYTSDTLSSNRYYELVIYYTKP